MRRYKRLILTSAGIIFLLIPAKGQNTNSPYSRYGYGVLSDRAIGASQAMGGISYGMRGVNTNPGNPASYSSIDSLTFIFDMGISYTNVKFSDGVNKENYTNGGLDYITMLFPISKKLGMSLGLLPFSSVGYNFGSVDNEEELSTKRVFEGSGGFNEVYAGLGYQPIKNLSIGANIAYLFGNVKHSNTLSFPNQTATNVENRMTKLTMNGLKFDFGVQYELAINNKNSIILGAVFSPKFTHTGKIEQTFNVGSNVNDTVYYIRENAETQIASTYGFGFTWKHDLNLIIGADVTYQDWSKSKYSKYMEDGLTDNNRFNNTWKFNGGIEYSIAPQERGFINKMKFRGGLNYSNSYINVMTDKGVLGKYKEYGATLGLGLPIRDNLYSGRTSYINIGFEYRKLKPNISNMVKEDYFGISLNMNINELWFFKNKLR